jgi:hypothetical protein
MDPLALGNIQNDGNDDQAGRLASEEAVVVTPRNADQAETHGNGQTDDAGDGAVPDRQLPGTEGLLPNKAAEDDPKRWGDGPDDDHDAWLKENKPPHWG